MSAPNTNVEKQSQRHRGPLTGIAIALIWAGVLFAGLMVWTAYKADNPAAQSPAEIVAD